MKATVKPTVKPTVSPTPGSTSRVRRAAVRPAMDRVPGAEVDGTGPEGRPPSWMEGFGNGMAQAVTLVVTPVLFGLAGALLDRWLGTRPALMLALGAFGFAGTFVSTYYRFKADLERAEADKPWRRGRR